MASEEVAEHEMYTDEKLSLRFRSLVMGDNGLRWRIPNAFALNSNIRGALGRRETAKLHLLENSKLQR